MNMEPPSGGALTVALSGSVATLCKGLHSVCENVWRIWRRISAKASTRAALPLRSPELLDMDTKHDSLFDDVHYGRIPGAAPAAHSGRGR